MDANVIRVVARLFRVTGSPATRETQARLNALAGWMLDEQRPGDFNQAR